MARKPEFINHYKVLGLDINATLSEISKSYKKLALKLHPDKNPNDKNAALKFHNLNNSYLVLTDEKAKKAFDDILRAKQAQIERNAKLDAKRKKFYDEREKVVNIGANDYEELLKNYEKEQSLDLINKEENKFKKNTQNKNYTKKDTSRIKVSWKCNCSSCVIDKNTLNTLFSKVRQFLSVRKNSKCCAFVQEKETGHHRKNAIVLEKGLENHAFTISLIKNNSVDEDKKPPPSPKPNLSLEDFEEEIFSQIK